MATIQSATGYYCTDVPTFFIVRGGPSTASFTWALPPNRGASFVSVGHDSSMVCMFANAGTIVFSVTIANGTLTSVVTKTITVTRSAVASFNASLITTGYPTELSLTDYSSNALKTYWSYNNSTLKDSASHLQRAYGASGSYTVMLKAIGRNGCNDSLTYAFRISDSSSITLPNIFSPNDDGVNDIYRPIFRGISSLSAWVYNRYGVLITSWDRVNGFWDGYTTSGLECSPGEYFIVLRASGFDGRSYKLKSTITLVR